MPDDKNPASAGAEAVRLTPDVAKAALAFLERATLQGFEVEAFMRVRVALEAVAMGGR
jgi:hypothetical protein